MNLLYHFLPFILPFSFTSTEALPVEIEVPVDIYEDATCDPAGTQTEIALLKGKKCVCWPGYSGTRCQTIFRCRSGRAMNVSCARPPSGYEETCKRRCLPEIKHINVCTCFAGYTGDLCQFRDEQMNTESPEQLAAIKAFFDEIDRSKEKKNFDNSEILPDNLPRRTSWEWNYYQPSSVHIDDIDEEVSRRRKEVVLDFVIKMCMLALFMIVIVLCLVIYFKKQRTQRPSRCRHHCRRHHEHSYNDTHRAQFEPIMAIDPKDYIAPPIYEEIDDIPLPNRPSRNPMLHV